MPKPDPHTTKPRATSIMMNMTHRKQAWMLVYKDLATSYGVFRSRKDAKQFLYDKGWQDGFYKVVKVHIEWVQP